MRRQIAVGEEGLMFLKILSGAVLCAALQTLAGAQPTLSYQSHELKEGRNYIQKLTATLAVGEAMGETNYRYSIDIPPSRGATPTVALEYSSHAAVTEYGYGWNLTIPIVERSDREGVPISAINPFRPIYRYREGHQLRELVQIGASGDWQLFREADEHTYSRYYLNVSSNSWVIERTDGLRITLGAGNAKRGQDPASGFATTNSWLADRLEDTHHNFATYTYVADPWAAAPTWNSRLSSISYNGNSASGQSPNLTISFQWTTYWGGQSPIPQSYRNGYRREFGQDVLSTITVTAPPMPASGPATVPTSSPSTRTYRVGYAPCATGCSTDNFLRLTSLQQDSTPEIDFSYSTTYTGFNADQPTIVGPQDQSVTDFPNDLGKTIVYQNGDGTTTSRTIRATADLNSDGRLDILDLESGAPVAWLNTPSGYVRTAWQPLSGVINGLDTSSLRRVETNSFETDTTQDFIDINGDGYPDIVFFTGNPLVMAYCPGNGHGFEPCGPYGARSTNIPYIRHEETTGGVQVTDIDLIDIDGDGRVDDVSLDLATGKLTVFRNLGTGFDVDPQAGSPYIISMPLCATGYVVAYPYCLRENFGTSVANSGQPNRLLGAETRDINGDGIADFVLLANGGTTSSVSISLGTGTGFIALTPSASDLPADIGTGYQSSAGDYVEYSGLIDFNGDGLPDFVTANCSVSPASVQVRYNIGGYFDHASTTYHNLADRSGMLFEYPCAQRTIMSSGGLNETIFSVTSELGDMDGDGLVDFVRSELDPLPIPPYSTFAVLVNYQQYAPPHVLTVITSLNGNYQELIRYAAQTGDTPYPVHAPIEIYRSSSQLYADEASSQFASDVQYEYSRSHFNRALRQFAGFDTVVANHDPFASDETSSYTTSDLAREAGLPLTQSLSNYIAQGAAEEIVNTYNSRQHENGHWITDLVKTVKYTGLRSRVTDYEGIDDYGNVTDWLQEADDPTNNVLHHSVYVTRDDGPVGFVLSLISEQSSSSQFAGAGPRSRTYYDDPNTLGAIPTNGNLVRTESEIDPNEFVSKTYAFDLNGNVASATDEAGYTTTHNYDSLYSLYDVVSQNSVGKTYTVYHALTGDQAMSCGPRNDGGATPKWNCNKTEEDSLGRTLATWVTDDTWSLQQLKQVSYNDTTYPLSTTVVTRGTSHAIQYRDAFGDPIETRVEETPGIYRVYEAQFDGYGHPIRSELARRESSSSYSHNTVDASGRPLEGWLYTYDYVHDTIESISQPRESGDNSPPATSYRIVRPEGVASYNEDGAEVDYYLDALGRVTDISRIGSDLGPAVTTFKYSLEGSITSIIDPNDLVTTYARRLNGWLFSTTTPSNELFTFAQDARGNVTQTVDPRGITTTYGYDIEGRKRTIVTSGEPAGVRHVNSVIDYYSTASCMTALCAQNAGLLMDEVSDGIGQTYTWEPSGALHTQTVTQGSISGTNTYSYILGGVLSQLATPDTLITYSLNLDDSVSAIRNSRLVNQNVATYTYDDAGNVSNVGGTLGLSEVYTRDRRERILGIYSNNLKAAQQTHALVDDRVQLSKASVVTQLSRYGMRPGPVVRSTPDVYAMSNDVLGRVTDVLLNGAIFGHYEYDLGDRILSFSEANGAPGVSSYRQDALQSRTAQSVTRTWSYDAAGEVVADSATPSAGPSIVRTHSWDALGRYAGTVGRYNTDYYYTPRGALSLVNGEGDSQRNTLMLGDRARFDKTAGVWTTKIIGPTGLVAESTGTQVDIVHRTLTDTVAAITRWKASNPSSASIVRQEEYLPFGSVASSYVYPLFSHVEDHFQGLRRDQVTVAGGRAYDSNSGSWLSRDQVVLTSPEMVLRDARIGAMYSYDYNNPYTRRDPNGHCIPCIVVIYVLMTEDTDGAPSLSTGTLAWRAVVLGASVTGGVAVSKALGDGLRGAVAGGGVGAGIGRAGSDIENGKVSSPWVYGRDILTGGLLSGAIHTLGTVGARAAPEEPVSAKPTKVGGPLESQTREELLDSKATFEANVREHVQKRADYIRDPLAHDNLGVLKNAAEEHKPLIIQGRVNAIDKQIRKNQTELDKANELLKKMDE